MDPPEHNAIELSKTGEDDSTLPQTQLLSTRLALVAAAAQPPATWAPAYKNLIYNLAHPRQTHAALQHLHTTLDTKDKASLVVAEPFQYAFLWYQGTFHIGHSLCLTTEQFPTIGNHLGQSLLALGKPNDKEQHIPILLCQSPLPLHLSQLRA